MFFFLPGLLHLMTDSGNPRVQAHSGAALVNFSEDCPKNILLPYLPDIMTRLKEELEAKVGALAARLGAARLGSARLLVLFPFTLSPQNRILSDVWRFFTYTACDSPKTGNTAFPRDEERRN